MEGGGGGGRMSPLRGPPADSTQLEFHQAMKDFQTMFPDMDPDVIEAVLRANNGTVDATIDQLLAMSTDVENERLRSQLEAQEPSLASAGSTPRNTVIATPSKASTTSAASAATSRVSSLISGAVPSGQANLSSPQHAQHTSPGASRGSTDLGQTNRALRDLKNWNPPLVGPLPKSFLRLDNAGLGSGVSSGSPTSASGGTGAGGAGVVEASPAPGGGPGDAELAQFLEDERMAIFLQNEEFMRELRRNEDFMSSLDGAQPGGHKGDDSQAHMHDDVLFREKLKNMGKVSRRKFAQMARLFQRTSAMATGSKGGGKFKHINPIPSRDKLLLGDEPTSDGEEPETPKPKSPL